MDNTNKNNYNHSEEFRAAFGHRLRELRKNKGYSIEYTVSSMNLPRSTYSGWELGKRVPLSKSLDALAEFFNTTVDYLMLKTDDPGPDTNELDKILIKDITWKGKSITPQQANKLAAIIEAYLDNE